MLDILKFGYFTLNANEPPELKQFADCLQLLFHLYEKSLNKNINKTELKENEISFNSNEQYCKLEKSKLIDKNQIDIITDTADIVYSSQSYNDSVPVNDELNACTLDFSPNFKENLNDHDNQQRTIEDCLRSTSPIFSSKLRSSKSIISKSNYSDFIKSPEKSSPNEILRNIENDIKIKESPTKLIKNTKLVQNKKEMLNTDTIKQSIYSNVNLKPNNELAISTLCYIDTTTLPNGKKLKQSKLILKPMRKMIDLSSNIQDDQNESFYKSMFDEDVLEKISSSIEESDDSILPCKSTKNLNETIYDNIIEASPQPQRSFKFRSQKKFEPPAKKQCTEDNNSHMSTTENKTVQSIHEPNVTYGHKTKLNISSSSFSPKNVESKYIDNHEFKNKPDVISKKLHNNLTNKRDSDVFHNNKTELRLFNDIDIENYEIKPKIIDKNYVSEENSNLTPLRKNYPSSHKTTLSKRTPVKRNLFMNNDNKQLITVKNAQPIYNNGPIRKKSERAKLNGWSCWECKQYYETMGLSETELQKRMNQCSRHRVNKGVKLTDSPENFWNPEFPETCTSTFCED